MRVTVLVIGAAVAALGAVTAAAPAPPSRSCPLRADAVRMSAWRASPRLRGDVDGDGRTDRVSIRFAPGAPASCGFLLLVETRHGAFAMRLPESYKTTDLPIHEWPFPEPYLAAVVRLDAHRSQIVVARSHGASVVSASLYGVVGGSLRALRVGAGPGDGELSLFGTVGTGDTNVRCDRGGPLVVLAKWPIDRSGRRWGASRRLYRLAGASLRLVHARTVSGTLEGMLEQTQRWGMAAVPFTGCTVDRGRRL